MSQLETDKARLMDRVEELTGEPLGDILAPIGLPGPRLPPGITVPGGDGSRKADANVDEKKALGSIVRIAAVGGAGGRAALELARAKRNYAATPAEALAAVRRLRAEHEALRKRLFELMPQLSNAERYTDARAELARVGAAVATMEQFVGGTNPEVSADDLSGRMDDIVGSVAILSAELHSARRQHAALQHLLTSCAADSHSAHARTGGAAATAAGQTSGSKETQSAAAEIAALRAQLKGFATASAQQIRDLRSLDDTSAQTSAKDAKQAASPDGTQAKSGQHQPAKAPKRLSISFGMDRHDSEHQVGTKRDGSDLTDESVGVDEAEQDVQSALTAGNAAVNIARVERVRAKRLAQEIAALKQEKEQLLEQLEAAPAAPGEFLLLVSLKSCFIQM